MKDTPVVPPVNELDKEEHPAPLCESAAAPSALAPRPPHNFGPASSRDAFLYTSERPGGDPCGADSNISMTEVDNWIEFMKSMQIRQVLMLLDDNELEHYEGSLSQRYQDAGMEVHHEPMLENGAPNRIYEIISNAERREQKVVAHCTHGMGRSGRVSAAWLVMRYGLTPEEATGEVMAQAQKDAVERIGDAEKLKEWLETFQPMV